MKLILKYDVGQTVLHVFYWHVIGIRVWLVHVLELKYMYTSIQMQLWFLDQNHWGKSILLSYTWTSFSHCL